MGAPQELPTPLGTHGAPHASPSCCHVAPQTSPVSPTSIWGSHVPQGPTWDILRGVPGKFVPSSPYTGLVTPNWALGSLRLGGGYERHASGFRGDLSHPSGVTLVFFGGHSPPCPRGSANAALELEGAALAPAPLLRSEPSNDPTRLEFEEFPAKALWKMRERKKSQSLTLSSPRWARSGRLCHPGEGAGGGRTLGVASCCSPAFRASAAVGKAKRFVPQFPRCRSPARASGAGEPRPVLTQRPAAPSAPPASVMPPQPSEAGAQHPQRSPGRSSAHPGPGLAAARDGKSPL